MLCGMTIRIFIILMIYESGISDQISDGKRRNRFHKVLAGLGIVCRRRSRHWSGIPGTFPASPRKSSRVVQFFDKKNCHHPSCLTSKMLTSAPSHTDQPLDI